MRCNYVTFALETDVNHLLKRLYEEFPEDKQNEVFALDKAYWLTLNERIELFCEWIGASWPDFRKRPFQMVSILKKFEMPSRMERLIWKNK